MYWLCFALPLARREREKNQGASVSVCAPQPLRWSRECSVLRYTPSPSLPNSPIHLGGAFFSPKTPPRPPPPPSTHSLTHSLIVSSRFRSHSGSNPPPLTPNDHIALLFRLFILFYFILTVIIILSLVYLSYTPSLARLALRHEPLLSKSHAQHAMILFLLWCTYIPRPRPTLIFSKTLILYFIPTSTLSQLPHLITLYSFLLLRAPPG